jgi:hypothetical protein
VSQLDWLGAERVGLVAVDRRLVDGGGTSGPRSLPALSRRASAGREHEVVLEAGSDVPRP